MQTIVRNLLAIVSVGAALFLAYHQYHIFYVAIFLLFAFGMMKDIRAIYAKSGDKELDAQFGDADDTMLISSADKLATRRLSRGRDSLPDDVASASEDELESPAP